MRDKDIIDMVQRCIHEIRELRAQRDAMAPQAEAYTVIRGLVGLLAPKTSQHYSEDIVWRLEKQIRDLEAQEVKPAPAPDDIPF